jgi:hypothetical protein
MEKTGVAPCIVDRACRAHAATVPVPILLCSRSDSIAPYGPCEATPAQAVDAAGEIPYAIALRGPGGGVQRKSREQPQPNAIAYAPSVEMRSADEERELVPSAQNYNAFKHGRYTAESVARRRELSGLFRSKSLLAKEVSN